MITLLHGDCLEKMTEIPDGSVDMVLADPPYGTTACQWDSIIPLEPMWEHLKRIIKPNGAIVMTASQPFTTTLIASNMKMFKYCWVWDKGHWANFAQANKRPLNSTDDVIVLYGKQCRYIPQKTANPKGVEKRSQYAPSKQKEAFVGQVSTTREYSEPSSKYEPDKLLPKAIIRFKRQHKPVHPTQKPVALMEYLIKTYTNEGETVLDFTMGSGTTGVACLNTNRNFIGIEKNLSYFNLATDRIHTSQPPLLPHI